MEKVEKKIVDILAMQTGAERESIVESARLVDDLGCDSLDLVELTMAFEEEFDIVLPDEEVENILTVGGAMALIKSKIKE